MTRIAKPIEGLPERVPAETDPCLCTAKHRPTSPFNDLHHIHPLEMGGPDVVTNKISVCSPTHRWVHTLLRQWYGKGAIQARPRNVPRYAYGLAVRGWNAWVAIGSPSVPGWGKFGAGG